MVVAETAKERNRKLSERRERFALAVANGSTYSAAYRLATGSTHRPTCEVNGFRWAQVPEVKARIEFHRNAIAQQWHLDGARRRTLLARIAEHKKGWRDAPSYSERIAAVKEDAILAGERDAGGNVSVAVGLQVGLGGALRAIAAEERAPIDLGRATIGSADRSGQSAIGQSVSQIGSRRPSDHLPAILQRVGANLVAYGDGDASADASTDTSDQPGPLESW